MYEDVNLKLKTLMQQLTINEQDIVSTYFTKMMETLKNSDLNSKSELDITKEVVADMFEMVVIIKHNQSLQMLNTINFN